MESATEGERQTFFKVLSKVFATGFQEALKKDKLTYGSNFRIPGK